MTEKLKRAAIAPKNPLLNASRASNLPHVPGIRVGDYIFLSGMVPIDPATGKPALDKRNPPLTGLQNDR